MSGIFGGRVEFSDKAFPVVEEYKEAGVHTVLKGAKPLPCATCRATGKVPRTASMRPPAGVVGRAAAKNWEEECPACGGYGDVFDARFPQRLVEVVDRLGHVLPQGAFADLRKTVSGHLAAALEVREKTLTTFRLKPIIQSVSKIDAFGGIDIDRTMTGVEVEADQQRPFRAEAAPAMEALWAQAANRPAGGQAVIIIGTVGERTEASGWAWMRMQPAKGTGAMLLARPAEQAGVPGGRAAVGGLMVGRWIPDSAAPAAAGPSAPGGPASAPGAPRPPAPVSLSGVAPGSLPVVLIVVAAGGR